MGGASHGADGGGLGKAGKALEEDVAAGDEADEETFDEVGLADDDLGDFDADLLQVVCGCDDLRFELRGGVRHR